MSGVSNSKPEGLVLHGLGIELPNLGFGQVPANFSVYLNQLHCVLLARFCGFAILRSSIASNDFSILRFSSTVACEPPLAGEASTPVCSFLILFILVLCCTGGTFFGF